MVPSPHLVTFPLAVLRLRWDAFRHTLFHGSFRLHCLWFSPLRILGFYALLQPADLPALMDGFCLPRHAFRLYTKRARALLCAHSRVTPPPYTFWVLVLPFLDHPWTAPYSLYWFSRTVKLCVLLSASRLFVFGTLRSILYRYARRWIFAVLGCWTSFTLLHTAFVLCWTIVIFARAGHGFYSSVFNALTQLHRSRRASTCVCCAIRSLAPIPVAAYACTGLTVWCRYYRRVTAGRQNSRVAPPARFALFCLIWFGWFRICATASHYRQAFGSPHCDL